MTIYEWRCKTLSHYNGVECHGQVFSKATRADFSFCWVCFYEFSLFYCFSVYLVPPPPLDDGYIMFLSGPPVCVLHPKSLWTQYCIN